VGFVFSASDMSLLNGFLGNAKRGWMAEGNPTKRIHSPK
jgi:hypothetical protein